MQSRSLVSEDSQESILNSKLQVTKTLLDEKKFIFFIFSKKNSNNSNLDSN